MHTAPAHTGRSDYDHLLRITTIPASEPRFLIRGQDAVGAATVRAYVQLAQTAGADPALLELAASQADRMEAWPHTKLPDVDLPEHERQQLAYAWSRRQWSYGFGSVEAIAEARGRILEHEALAGALEAALRDWVREDLGLGLKLMLRPEHLRALKARVEQETARG